MAYNVYVIKVVILVNLQNNNTFVLKKTNCCNLTGDSGYANRSYLPMGKNGTRCSQIQPSLQRHSLCCVKCFWRVEESLEMLDQAR